MCSVPPARWSWHATGHQLTWVRMHLRPEREVCPQQVHRRPDRPDPTDKPNSELHLTDLPCPALFRSPGWRRYRAQLLGFYFQPPRNPVDRKYSYSADCDCQPLSLMTETCYCHHHQHRSSRYILQQPLPFPLPTFRDTDTFPTTFLRPLATLLLHLCIQRLSEKSPDGRCQTFGSVHVGRVRPLDDFPGPTRQTVANQPCGSR